MVVRALLLVLTLGGCAAVTPVASVVGATASGVSAYYTVTQSGVTVISKECLWYRRVRLSDTAKAVLPRKDKEQIARNNMLYARVCKAN